MAMTNYKAISFDCFGTLVDWESGIVDSLKSTFSDEISQVADADLVERFLAHESAILANNPTITYTLALAQTFKAITQGFGLTCSDEKANDFGRSIATWPLFSDTLDALSYLSGSHQLVVLSNIDDVSINKVKTRLSCDFFRIYTAQAIGTFKPAINNFQYLIANLAELDIGKDDILHVSVSRFHDIEPAAANGLDTAWINRAQTLNGTLSIHSDFTPVIEPTYTFSSLSEMVSAHKAGQ